jgi:predicted dehydrogenase
VLGSPLLHEPFRVGLIGCGFQGEHWANCLDDSAQFTLAACCDADLGRARDLAGRGGTAIVTSDWRDLTTRSDLDAVIIATTTHTHAEIALESARSGKHILLEKPMAITLGDCLTIEQAAAEHGVVLMVGFKFRFAPALVAARAAVAEPLVLITQTIYDADEPVAGWVADPAKSGGWLVTGLVHVVDAMRYLSGSDVTRVCAAGGALAFPAFGIADTAVASVSFANGAVGSIAYGLAGRSGVLGTWAFQTIGVGVNATVSEHGTALSVHQAGAAADIHTTDPVSDPFEVGMRDLLDEFANAMVCGQARQATARDGTYALAGALAIVEAIRTGRPVEIAEPRLPR